MSIQDIRVSFTAGEPDIFTLVVEMTEPPHLIPPALDQLISNCCGEAMRDHVQLRSSEGSGELSTKDQTTVKLNYTSVPELKNNFKKVFESDQAHELIPEALRKKAIEEFDAAEKRFLRSQTLSMPAFYKNDPIVVALLDFHKIINEATNEVSGIPIISGDAYSKIEEFYNKKLLPQLNSINSSDILLIKAIKETIKENCKQLFKSCGEEPRSEVQGKNITIKEKNFKLCETILRERDQFQKEQEQTQQKQKQETRARQEQERQSQEQERKREEERHNTKLEQLAEQFAKSRGTLVDDVRIAEVVRKIKTECEDYKKYLQSNPINSAKLVKLDSLINILDNPNPIDKKMANFVLTLERSTLDKPLNERGNSFKRRIAYSIASLGMYAIYHGFKIGSPRFWKSKREVFNENIEKLESKLKK